MQNLEVNGLSFVMSHFFPNPLNYVAFKKLFGQENNKDVLISFVNDTLQLSGEQKIADLEFLDLSFGDNEKGDAQFKATPIDVLCTDAQGDQIIIELGTFQRKLFSLDVFQEFLQKYARKVYFPELRLGGKYEKVKHIHLIAIVANNIMSTGEVLFDEKPIHGPLNLGQGIGRDKFSVTYIEVQKFTNRDFDKNPNLTPTELNLQCWGYFFSSHFKFADKINKLSHVSVPILQKGFQSLSVDKWNSDEFKTYIEVESRGLSKRQHDETMHNMGFQEGRLYAKKAIAKALLDQDPLTAEAIIKAIGLSMQDMEKLKASVDCV